MLLLHTSSGCIALIFRAGPPTPTPPTPTQTPGLGRGWVQSVGPIAETA